MELDPRKSRILTCVVESYIRTGEDRKSVV